MILLGTECRFELPPIVDALLVEPIGACLTKPPQFLEPFTAAMLLNQVMALARDLENLTGQRDQMRRNVQRLNQRSCRRPYILASRK